MADGSAIQPPLKAYEEALNKVPNPDEKYLVTSRKWSSHVRSSSGIPIELIGTVITLALVASIRVRHSRVAGAVYERSHSSGSDNKAIVFMPLASRALNKSGRSC